MRFSAPKLGEFFGHLSKNNGEYHFLLPPTEQKPFKGFFKTSLKSFYWYVVLSWMYYVPTSVTAYLTYKWAKQYHARSLRKNPKDFESDV